jgi:hypothetical protein
VPEWATVTPTSGWRFAPGEFTGDGKTDLLKDLPLLVAQIAMVNERALNG